MFSSFSSSSGNCSTSVSSDSSDECGSSGVGASVFFFSAYNSSIKRNNIYFFRILKLTLSLARSAATQAHDQQCNGDDNAEDVDGPEPGATLGGLDQTVEHARC